MDNTSMSIQNYTHKFHQPHSNNLNSKRSSPALHCLVWFVPFISVMCQPRRAKLPEFEGWLLENLLTAPTTVRHVSKHLLRPLKVLLKYTRGRKLDHVRLNSLAKRIYAESSQMQLWWIDRLEAKWCITSRIKCMCVCVYLKAVWVQELTHRGPEQRGGRSNGHANRMDPLNVVRSTTLIIKVQPQAAITGGPSRWSKQWEDKTDL